MCPDQLFAALSAWYMCAISFNRWYSVCRPSSVLLLDSSYCYDLVDTTGGDPVGEADVFNGRADHDAVIGPRHHVVAVHLLHDRPRSRVVLRDAEVRDLPAHRPDRKLHAELRSEAPGPRATRDDHRGRSIDSPSTTTVAGDPRPHFVDRTARTSTPCASAPRRNAAHIIRPSTGPPRVVERATPLPSTGTISRASSAVISLAPVARSATHSHADRSVSRVASWRIPHTAQPVSGPSCVSRSS